MKKQLSIVILIVMTTFIVSCGGGGSSNGAKPGKWDIMQWDKDKWQ